MPTLKNADAGLAKATAVYNAMSPANQALLPEPTAANAVEFGKAIMKYQPVYNEFMHQMLNKVIFGWARNAEDRNPYAQLEKGTLEYGYTLEEAFADALDVEDWTACEVDDFNDLFGVKPPRVYTLYHSINFQKRVSTSIQDKIMRRAFTDWGQLNDMIARIVRTLYTSMIGAEREAAAKLLAIAHEGGYAYPMKVNGFNVTAVNKDNMYANAILQQAAVNRIGVNASRAYNYMGVSTITNKEDVFVLLTPEYIAAQGVEVLATAFNMDKAELMGHILMVGDYGGAENDGCVGWIIDRDWFQIWINDRQMTENYNARKRAFNYFYFTDAIFSFSLFSNCIEMVSGMRTISAVAITAGQSAAKCATTQIEATVTNTGKGGWSSKLNWSITGNTSKRTFISPFGALYVAPDENASSISVTATSAQDGTKTDTKPVAITAAA